MPGESKALDTEFINASDGEAPPVPVRLPEQRQEAAPAMINGGS